MLKNLKKNFIFIICLALALIDLSTQSTPQQCYYKSNISCTNRYGQCVSSYSECYNGQSCYYCNKLFEISSGQFYCGDKGDCGLDNYTDFSGLYIFLIVFGSMFVLAVAGFIIFKQYKKRRLRKKVEKIKKIRQLQQEQSMKLIQLI
ncbi:hypothetical protein PPERSA_12841 [Pseudocohnilembus persalinus]|uniref:Transmembrane protein n=1 Tax=Pseudocohnilembus persalinus TaxID=266149 RepID=A0A0V0QW29_PSEPJ|nr:hypothetical protein PPERSA_12841 [Pseudocohnilembus persalinus]|eukprot:KRX06152.1 hypothetical protein PPERSA_12841 [Pseudocohnilembus persalinus]